MLAAIRKRRSIRQYLDQPVEEEKLHRMVESARWAPSGNNSQPWRFILVKSDETKRKLAQVSHHQQWMLSAPVHLVCIADPAPRYNGRAGPGVDESSPEHELKQAIRDTAIAAEHLVLEAVHQGLGTCWVAWFVQEEIRAVLNIPEDKYVVAIITAGYPAGSPSPTPRRKLEDLVFDESWPLQVPTGRDG